MQKVTLQVAFDVGGTFTDIVIARSDGLLFTYKILTLPSTLGRDVLACIDAALSETPGGEVSGLVHATTFASNMVLEGKGAVAGLIATKGFRDELEIRRFFNPNLTGYLWQRTPPLIPRRRRLEVTERITADGGIDTPLSEADVHRATDRLLQQSVEAIAICLINSYVNPIHEQRVAQWVRERAPDIHVSASCDVSPEIREYERTSTTALTAYLAPGVGRYIDSLEQHIGRYGRTLFIMQANGGLVPAAHVRQFPAGIIESGPASGVLGASHLARELGIDHAVAFDMGGTTAKACLIENGQPGKTRDMEVGGDGLLKGAGYALRFPGFDLEEIGAGGGSIAWADEGGALRIGPASAGAVPGPVCYGRGGVEPTTTDANVVLGYMSPLSIAGGTVSIDRAAAVRVFEQGLCSRLNLSALDCAYGVHRVANATMMRALRAVTTERGRNPRECTLIAFGGAGPIHAANLASELEISRVIIPPYSGLFSALSLHTADLKFDFVLGITGGLDAVGVSRLSEGYEQLMARAQADLKHAGIDPGSAKYHRFIDIHYQKQTTELTLSYPDDVAAATDVTASVAMLFHREHLRVYGYQRPEEPLGVLNLWITASVPRHEQRGGLGHSDTEATPRPSEDSRTAYFGPELGPLKTQIFSRSAFAGRGVTGPAIVEQFDTTVLVPPGWRGSLDHLSNIVLEAA